MDSIEELLQIKVHHPATPVLDVAAGFAHGRVTASLGPEAMARIVEVRIDVGTEHLMHGLLNDPVDHVRDAKTSLPAARLGNPDSSNLARPVATFQ